VKKSLIVAFSEHQPTKCSSDIPHALLACCWSAWTTGRGGPTFLPVLLCVLL